MFINIELKWSIYFTALWVQCFSVPLVSVEQTINLHPLFQFQSLKLWKCTKSASWNWSVTC